MLAIDLWEINGFSLEIWLLALSCFFVCFWNWFLTIFFLPMGGRVSVIGKGYVQHALSLIEYATHLCAWLLAFCFHYSSSATFLSSLFNAPAPNEACQSLCVFFVLCSVKSDTAASRGRALEGEDCALRSWRPGCFVPSFLSQVTSFALSLSLPPLCLSACLSVVCKFRFGSMPQALSHFYSTHTHRLHRHPAIRCTCTHSSNTVHVLRCRR